MSAQLHALLGKHQIARSTLETVAEIVDNHLRQHSCNKAKPHIETGLFSQCPSRKSAQNYKGQKNWHFRQDGLQKCTDKCPLDSALIVTGEFQNS